MSDIAFDAEKHEYTVNGKKVPSVTQILDLLSYEEFGKIDKSTLDYAAKRGTAIHEATEALDLGLPADIDAEIEPYIRAYCDFTRDYRPSWMGIEDVVACRNYAGTVDRHGTIGEQEVILDIKTIGSPNRLTYIKVCLQTYLYSLCLEYGNIKLFALFLRKDGTYRLFDCQRWWNENMEDQLWQSALDILTSYNTIQRIKNKKGD